MSHRTRSADVARQRRGALRVGDEVPGSDTNVTEDEGTPRPSLPDVDWGYLPAHHVRARLKNDCARVTGDVFMFAQYHYFSLNIHRDCLL